MKLSITDLVKPLTVDQVKSSLLSIWASLGLPVMAWQPGGKARTILAVVSQKLADFTEVQAVIARGGLLEYAEGGWLTLLARSVYAVDRIPPSAGAGKLTLAKSKPGTLGPYAAGELHFANTVTGKTYMNAGTVTLPGNAIIEIDIVADEVGTASDASPGTITTLVTTILGVTCANTAPVLGSDEEPDEALRSRCRDKLGALSPNGPSAAYAYVARTSEINGGVSVNRVKVSAESSTGTVSVIVAGPNGPIDSEDVAKVDAAIQANAVPLCVTATTESAVNHVIPVTCGVWILNTAALTSADVTALVQDKLSDYFRSVPIGGYVLGDSGKVFRDALQTQIESVSPHIFHATLEAPASDVIMATNEVAALGAVAVSVTQVNG